MAAHSPPPTTRDEPLVIEAFTHWHDADGWHATWIEPLTDAECGAGRLVEQVNALTLIRLLSDCASQRVLRNIASPTFRTRDGR